MNKIFVICFLIYGAVSAFAMIGMDEQIQSLQDLVSRQANINKHMSDRITMHSKRIEACDRMIADVGVSFNRRLENHKHWTYNQIQKLHGDTNGSVQDTEKPDGEC